MLGTKDVKGSQEGGLSKTIQPGAHVLKINSAELKRFPFMDEDNGYYFILNVETKPIEGFEGFLINKEDESLGRHDGQVGQVKTNRYYYKDTVTKSGVNINRDMELLKKLKDICVATDSMEWYDGVHNKFETIEEFIEGFNTAMPFKDKFLNFTVAGKEFERNNGYTGYDLFVPKLTRGTVSFEAVDASPSKLIAFDEAKMWEKMVKKEVAGFGEGADDTATIPSAGEFNDAPDFEL